MPQIEKIKVEEVAKQRAIAGENARETAKQ